VPASVPTSTRSPVTVTGAETVSSSSIRHNCRCELVRTATTAAPSSMNAVPFATAADVGESFAASVR